MPYTRLKYACAGGARFCPSTISVCLFLLVLIVINNGAIVHIIRITTVTIIIVLIVAQTTES